MLKNYLVFYCLNLKHFVSKDNCYIVLESTVNIFVVSLECKVNMFVVVLKFELTKLSRVGVHFIICQKRIISDESNH